MRLERSNSVHTKTGHRRGEIKHSIIRNTAIIGGLILLDQATTQLGFSLYHANSSTAEANPVGQYFMDSGGGSALSAQTFTLSGMKLAIIMGGYSYLKHFGKEFQKEKSESLGGKLTRFGGKVMSGGAEAVGGFAILTTGFAVVNNLYHAGGAEGLWPGEAPWDPAIRYYIYNLHILDPLFQFVLDHT